MIINQQSKVDYTKTTQKFINNVLKNIAKTLGLPASTELSVLLVDNNYISELNFIYRGQNKPTDVLSFAMNELSEDEPDFKMDEEVNLLGDIVISLETALSQSEEYGHSFERELGFLLTHGMLHLLGYDHSIEEEEKTMRQLEERVMSVLKLER